jgi:DNA-binding response OmpR family regulator
MVQSEVLEEKADFLAKPFKPETLVRKLRELIRRPAHSSFSPPAKHDRAILLLVPDARLRTGIASILRVEGLQVLEAQTYADALIICQWHVGYIGLMLADRGTMSRLPAELNERLGQVRPEMRILCASADTAIGEPVEDRVRRVLEEWGMETNTGE